jgi:FKBP-type peptidyl-prolyl cis-trans isomerase FkpA
MIKNFSLFVSLFAAVVLLSSCEQEYESAEEMDKRIIGDYIRANNLSMTNRNDSLYYLVVKAGTGEAVKNSDRVPIIFTIRALDGSFSAMDTFAVGNRYGAFNQYVGYFRPEGLRVAVAEVLKNRGGEIKVIIPSRLGYGRNGAGGIPGNTSLEYTVKIVNEKKLREYDDQSIQKYLQRNSLSGFSKTASGLYYKILTPGTGSPITSDSTVHVKYVGKFLNNSVFNDFSNQTVSFDLGSEGLRQGWKEGVPLIKGGGKIQLILPSHLAYGLDGAPDASGNVSVPTAAILFFEIEVTDVDL